MSISFVDKLKALRHGIEEDLAAGQSYPLGRRAEPVEERTVINTLLRLEKRWERMLSAQDPLKALDVQHQAAQDSVSVHEAREALVVTCGDVEAAITLLRGRE